MPATTAVTPGNTQPRARELTTASRVAGGLAATGTGLAAIALGADLSPAAAFVIGSASAAAVGGLVEDHFAHAAETPTTRGREFGRRALEWGLMANILPAVIVGASTAASAQGVENSEWGLLGAFLLSAAATPIAATAAVIRGAFRTRS